MKMEFYPFSTGTYIVDKGTLDNKSWGIPYEHPLPVYVIRHPQGTVVFDTGHNHKGLEDPRGWYGSQIDGMTIKVAIDDCLPFRMQRAGIDPEEVTHVIMSHLHIDHAGEMTAFPKARFIVRASELSCAWWPPVHMRGNYVFNDLKDTRFYNFLELPDIIDFDVFGDGSLVVMHTPGHTPGHQSVIVTLPDYEKPMILCADACYGPANLEGALYGSTLMYNTASWYKTMDRFKYYQAIGYELWYGHHMETWCEQIRKFV